MPAGLADGLGQEGAPLVDLLTRARSNFQDTPQCLVPPLDSAGSAARAPVEPIRRQLWRVSHVAPDLYAVVGSVRSIGRSTQLSNEQIGSPLSWRNHHRHGLVAMTIRS
jgi:hypothetical protein